MSKGKKVEVTMAFPKMTKKKWNYIKKAENMLRKAGVDFDTGLGIPEKTYYWELDWSLKGAKIIGRFKKAQRRKKII